MDSKMKENEYPQENLNKLDWIELRNDMNQVMVQETFREKFKRKFSENPLVPIGSVATLAALSYGLWTLRTGDRQMSQYMMRARVLAQGFTIAALVAGIAFGVSKVNK